VRSDRIMEVANDENVKNEKLSQIKDMITYWFGNSNYPRDKFLRKIFITFLV
jgi:hypothetical protein